MGASRNRGNRRAAPHRAHQSRFPAVWRHGRFGVGDRSAGGTASRPRQTAGHRVEDPADRRSRQLGRRGRSTVRRYTGRPHRLLRGREARQRIRRHNSRRRVSTGIAAGIATSVATSVARGIGSGIEPGCELGFKTGFEKGIELEFETRIERANAASSGCRSGSGVERSGRRADRSASRCSQDGRRLCIVVGRRIRPNGARPDAGAGFQWQVAMGRRGSGCRAGEGVSRGIGTTIRSRRTYGGVAGRAGAGPFAAALFRQCRGGGELAGFSGTRHRRRAGGDIPGAAAVWRLRIPWERDSAPRRAGAGGANQGVGAGGVRRRWRVAGDDTGRGFARQRELDARARRCGQLASVERFARESPAGIAMVWRLDQRWYLAPPRPWTATSGCRWPPVHRGYRFAPRDGHLYGTRAMVSAAPRYR